MKQKLKSLSPVSVFLSGVRRFQLQLTGPLFLPLPFPIHFLFFNFIFIVDNITDVLCLPPAFPHFIHPLNSALYSYLLDPAKKCWLLPFLEVLMNFFWLFVKKLYGKSVNQTMKATLGVAFFSLSGVYLWHLKGKNVLFVSFHVHSVRQ